MSFKIKRNKKTKSFSIGSIEEQAALIMSFHFDPQRFLHEDETCEECHDYIQGNCQGKGFVGRQCFECMVEKVKSGVIAFGDSSDV